MVQKKKILFAGDFFAVHFVLSVVPKMIFTQTGTSLGNKTLKRYHTKRTILNILLRIYAGLEYFFV